MGASRFFGGQAREFHLSTKFYSTCTWFLNYLTTNLFVQPFSIVQFARRKIRDHVPLPPRHMQPLVSSHQRGPLRRGKHMHCSTARVPQDMSS
jgi:hypothetical protein